MTADSKKHRTREWERESEGERGSFTWLWGPIILLGGGGWGWGEPWGPGGPCGIAQKRRGKDKDKGRESVKDGVSEERRIERQQWWRETQTGEAGLLQGQRTVREQEPKLAAKQQQQQNKNKKMYKNKTLIFLYPKMVREEKGGGGRDSVRERGSREEQANDLALNERKQSETWRGCVLFCLSVMTLRSLLHALCYRC